MNRILFSARNCQDINNCPKLKEFPHAFVMFNASMWHCEAVFYTCTLYKTLYGPTVKVNYWPLISHTPMLSLLSHCMGRLIMITVLSRKAMWH